MIFNIQRYSIHDGEGIRTMVFYKGCPLRCQWCSNPESQSFGPSLMYDDRICKNFGDCIKHGKPAITLKKENISIDRSLLKQPEDLRDVCASKALTVTGNELSTAEIMDEIEKDLPFYHQSGGGVTLSGGEPLSQNDTISNLLNQIKRKKIHVSVETTLHVTWKQIERCLGSIDCFLVDLKHIDQQKFKQFTEGDLNLVLENLKKLDELNENIIIRIPVVPGFNHTEEEMFQIIDYVALLKSVKELHFIPFHNLGSEKYRLLGMDYPYQNYKTTSDSEIIPYLEYAKTKKLKTKIGG